MRKEKELCIRCFTRENKHKLKLSCLDLSTGKCVNCQSKGWVIKKRINKNATDHTRKCEHYI